MSEGDDLVWLRRELPWIDTGFLPRIPRERLDLLLRDLERLGFKLYVLDGERMSDADGCYAEVTRAFGFWGTWQGNPDAFDDFFGDVELTRRAAIVWTSTRTLADADPIVFARVVSLLMLTRAAIQSDGGQLEVLLTE